MKIIPVLCLEDNYAYLVHDEQRNQTLVIDPSEAEPVLQVLEKYNWKLNLVLNTHHHWDHVGGNLKLKSATNCQILGNEKDKARLPGVDKTVEPNSKFSFGNHTVEVIDIPGHTHGHIAYYFTELKALFCGDTLFSLGCGRLFEGTAAEMFSSLSRLAALPKETSIYPGHEYTASNLTFALTLEPNSSSLLKKKSEVQSLRSKGKPTIPSTLQVELELNPFLKAKNVEEFALLRTQKDKF